LTDEEAIRQTLAEFCQYLDDRQFEDWWMLFTEDGAFNERVGRDTIRDMILDGELAHMPELSRKHAIVNITIAVNGDEATTKSDLLMYDRLNGDDSAWTLRVGRYEDLLVREADRWRFKKRYLRFV
jgi:3-phenylpropionate/cinnamic acid dioxygenase small subunit